MNRWTRRDVLKSLGRLPLLAGFPAALAACGGGGGSSSSGGGGGGGGSSTLSCGTTPALEYTIAGNHGHTACINQAVLDAPAGTTVTLTMGNGHTHTISLTADQVTAIRDKTMNVAETSSLDGHTHLVTFIA